MKLTENFNRQEFDCRNGTKVPAQYMDNVKELAKNLQVLRDFIGEPVRVNSGYRTPAYNKSVGGKSASQHLQAKAADITAKSYTPKQLADIIKGLIISKKMKQGGVGVYPGFVHYDIRGRAARW